MSSDAPRWIEPQALRDEGVALVRALCGGFIFAVPIIYTMEVWWLGHSLPLWKLLTIVGVGFGLAAGMNRYSGFREGEAWPEVLEDAVITLAVGLVVAFVMLVVLGVVNHLSSPRVVLGQVIILSIPLSFGASLARSQFLRAERADDDEDEEELSGWRADVRDFGMTVMGGTFIGLAIAPTEEVLMIASQCNLWRLVAIIGLSLVVSYAIIFAADFAGQQQRHTTQGALQSPVVETLFSYVVSLGVSFAMVGLFGYISGVDALIEVLPMVVVLALPVTLGGAAGRLLL